MAEYEAELERSIQLALPTAAKSALFTAKKQQAEVLKYTIEGLNSLAASAELLKDVGDEASQRKKLEKTAKEFAVLETRLTNYKKEIEKLEGQVNSGKLDQAKVEKALQHGLRTPRVKYAQHPMYRKFCDKAGIELAEDENQDVVLQGSESNHSMICPVTQLVMTEPLQNPQCHHTYSKQGILSHLKRSHKCPVGGCPKKVVFEDLERDVEMEIQLQETQQTNGLNRNGDMEDDASEDEYVVE